MNRTTKVLTLALALAGFSLACTACKNAKKEEPAPAAASTAKAAEHPKGEHPKGEHPKGEHPKGEHPK